jgi:hypothetical protein
VSAAAPGEQDAVPTGREVRRWTRERAGTRTAAGVVELLGDVYTALVALAVSTAVALPFSAQLGDLTGGVRTGPGVGLEPGWVALLAALAGLAWLAGSLGRLGPVSASAPEVVWWLPLPGDRRSLLRPAALRWPAAAAVLGGVVGLLTGVGATPAPGAAVLAGAAAVGAGAAAASGSVIGLCQASARAHRCAVAVADGALAAAPLLALVLALGPPAPPQIDPTAALGAGAFVLAAAVLLTRALDRRTGRFPDAVLRERGAVTDEAAAAVLSMDTRALGRVLSEPPALGRGHRVRSSGLRWLRRTPARWSPVAAIVTADALLLARSPRHVVQVVASAGLPLLVLALPSPGVAVTAVAVLAGASAAALATAEGARRSQVNPVLDALLPLSQAQVRACRLVVPVIVLVVWSAAVLAAVGWRDGAVLPWALAGALAGPAWAAAAVRAAYRDLPDFSGPLVHTPMGSIPPGTSAVAVIGPDVALVGAVPVVLALVDGQPSALLLAVQAAVSGAALAFVATPPRRPR